MNNNSLSDFYSSGLISGEAFLYCVDRNFYSLQDVIDSGILDDVSFPYTNDFVPLLSKDNEVVENEPMSESTLDSNDIEDIYYEELSKIDVRTANALSRLYNTEYHNLESFINDLLDEESDFWNRLRSLRNVGSLSMDRAHQFSKELSIILNKKSLKNTPPQIDSIQGTVEKEQQVDFESLVSVFESRINELSVRSKNAVQRLFNGCNRSMATFYKEISRPNYSSIILKLPHAGKKTLKEITPWLEDFRKLLDMHASDCMDIQSSNYVEAQRLTAIGFRGDLSAIVAIKNDLNTFPYFRVFKEYIESFSDREQYIIAHQICIFDKQIILNNNEVATSLGISSERVRQIRERIKVDVNRYAQFLRNSTTDFPLAEYYSQIDIHQINKIEETSFNENFLYWYISVLSPFEYSLYGDIDAAFETHSIQEKNLVIVPYRLAQLFDFSRFIQYFRDYYFAKRYESLEIELRDCICGFFTERIYFEHIEEIELQCKSIIKRLFAFEIYDGIVTIPQNAVKNNPELIEAILRDIGHPMTAIEIYTIFDSRYPNKTKSAKALMGAIHMCPNIVPMGRSGTYALAEWKEDKHRGGTIREFASEYLISLPYPIAPIEKIGEYVRQFRPTSTDKSIHANLLLEGAFAVYYKEGARYIGLDLDEYPNEYEKFEPKKDSRRDFSTSCTLLEEFVINNNRLPFSNTDDEEELRLCRFWGVQRQRYEKNQLKEEERRIIESMHRRFQGYKVQKKDYDWMQTFNYIKSYVLGGNEWTSLQSCYISWLYKQMNALKYNRISGNRRDLIVQLCNIISNAN